MPTARTTRFYSLTDTDDRLITKVTPEGTLNYTYDAASNVTSISSSNANGASVSYTYDSLNRLGTVVDNRRVPHPSRLCEGGDRNSSDHSPIPPHQPHRQKTGAESESGHKRSADQQRILPDK
jgi:YD repeat-containing protein